MQAAQAVDVMVVSLGSTAGLRVADEELVAALARAGASVTMVRAIPPRALRTMMLTDLAWSRAARAAVRHALAHGPRPQALIYSSTTAALLWPRPGAIRFDAPAATNRPGRHGLWQRPLERMRLRQSALLLPWSAPALEEAQRLGAGRDRALVLPVAVEPSLQEGERAGGQPRDIAAITYAANPVKKGLDRVLGAWRELNGARAGETRELVVAGASEPELRAAGLIGAMEGAAVRVVGRLGRDEYRALLRRARVFVCAPRREDYGLAQLEALADGCQLVTTPAPGPYVALPLARRLDARLVGEQLAEALRAALEDPLPDYSARAREALAPFSAAAVQRAVTEQLLSRLLG